ncbi:transcription initiation factor TFIID, subunit TAF6 [Guillardia theta CCMP2712]|uniref:Transcription initiation factor TFIID, subunit TAF6 n=1 Tax=Guillardia theta (strain CCMP2712) TaxID=905079 RepID=L1JHD2_GUITC|nr:transcription initiation factor TFIID, subunit TAF6 [Guillardia theta CCMP2712]EKX47505.1 transcription initiation factor TFIID, subunit TAF6 [Guillardia theta CCMP2712]|eukprot:XP_005834485.1 transcription initiation factor TFIID, subunit TAF6 [Guillardia theta CCMP2712]
MSIIREDLVQEAAAAAGVKNVGEKVAASLAADAEYRLREIIQDALNFKRHSRRRKLTPADINNALRVRNVEPLYGFTFPEPIVYTTKQGEGGGSQIIIEEKELEFDELLSAPLPKAPVEVTLRAHWLAIDGVQPLIPENPIPENLDVAAAGKKRKVKDSETSEKDPMVQDVLSQELQLYYENVTSAVIQGSPHILSAALSSLRKDPGLQALLPYFAQFITDEVKRSLKDLPILNALLSMTLAILSNAQLHVEPRLHELMPAVMTCMVGKQLCKSSLDPHWNLRDRAAKLLNFIVDRYAAPYSTLQQRITNTLLHAFLEPTKPLTTHYGAIAGLAALGPQTMNQLIVPNAPAYASLLQKYTFDNHIKRFEAIRVRGALLDAVGKSFTHTRV